MILIAFSLLAVSPGAAAPAAELPLTIENLGHHSIYNLYASARRGHWGHDRLDDATIPTGRSRTISIAHRRGQCLQRVRLVLADRRRVERRIDLCRGGHWTIEDDGDRFVPGA